MKSHRTAVTGFVGAILLASALAAIAQQANQPSTNQNSATPPATSTDTNQNVDTNRNTDANRTASSATGLSKLDAKTSNATVRASRLIGMNIKNSQDESVGEVKDLVIDATSGKIRYAAVTYGGFLGVGSKLFAVPFEAFHVRQSTAGTFGTNEYMLTLDVTKDQLNGAQGFDNDHWPDFANASFTQELDRRYKVDRSQANRPQTGTQSR